MNNKNNYYTMDPTPELQNTAYNLWQPFGQTNNKILVNSVIISNESEILMSEQVKSKIESLVTQ